MSFGGIRPTFPRTGPAPVPPLISLPPLLLPPPVGTQSLLGRAPPQHLCAFRQIGDAARQAGRCHVAARERDGDLPLVAVDFAKTAREILVEQKRPLVPALPPPLPGAR